MHKESSPFAGIFTLVFMVNDLQCFGYFNILHVTLVRNFMLGLQN